MFVSDLTDNFDEIEKELMGGREEFLNLFANILDKRSDLKVFEKFNSKAYSIHENIRPKIALVGELGVGKTTIANLVRTETIPVKNDPKNNKDIATIKIGNLHFELWDFTGEEKHGFLWSKFVKGCDAVILITDSTLENVEKSKYFLEIIEKSAPKSFPAVFANKQDLENPIEPNQIETILGIKTYSTTTKNPENRDKIIQIIVNILDMNHEVSNQLILINERKKLKNELENAQNGEKFVLASQIIRKILNICAELGDKSLTKEFDEIGQKINEKLEEEMQPQERPSPATTEPSETQEGPPKERLLKTLITNYMNEIRSITVVNVSDRGGTIILSVNKNESGEIEINKSMSEIIGKEDVIDTKEILVICPTCKEKKKITIPKTVVKEAKGVTTFSIPKQLVCKHHFQVFVDKNFSVRGYQKVDFKIDSYTDRIINEFGTRSNFFNITTTSDQKIAHCSMGINSILTTIAEPSTSDMKLRVFSEYVAGKVELILEGKENIDVKIPQVIRAISKTKGGILPKGDYSAKVILIGDYKVGKTSIIRRFVENRFQVSYKATLGVDISKKMVEIGEDTRINLLIWDIAGQLDQIKPYRKKFYEGASVAIIVLDRTRAETIKGVDLWYNDIKKSVPKDINIVLVGNKSDLVKDLKISEEDMKKVADQHGFHYLLTSAKTAENINDTFLYIAYKFIESV